MERIGPPLEALIRRLAETPLEFIDEPRIGSKGVVSVPALVNDLLGRFGHRGQRAVLERFQGKDAETDRNRLMLVATIVWLLTDEWFVGANVDEKSILRLLDETACELAAGMAAPKYIDDPERREELCRLALARLGFRPEGETPTQATDRLSALSGTERRRLLDASRAAEARARAIREALIQKQAEASADKWTRD